MINLLLWIVSVIAVVVLPTLLIWHLIDEHERWMDNYPVKRPVDEEKRLTELEKNLDELLQSSKDEGEKLP